MSFCHKLLTVLVKAAARHSVESSARRVAVWLAQLSEITLYYKTRTFFPCSIDENTGKKHIASIKSQIWEYLLTILLKLILSFKVATIRSNYKMEDILNGRGFHRNHI